MNLDNFLSTGLNLVGAFDPRVALFLFLVCFIGEAAVSIPYLLEGTWLLVGYQLSNGVLSPPHFLLLLFAAQAGRQAGALALYSFSRTGSGLLLKCSRRFKLDLGSSGSIPEKIFRRLDLLSPFSVALGRLVGLRVPLTVVLSARRKLRMLSLGVLLSSLVWEAVYIGVGMVAGATTALKPTHLFLFVFAGLTVVYGLTFATQRLIRGFAGRPTASTP